MPKVESIPVEAIRLDGNTQSREKVDPEVVSEYSESIKSGAKMPPADVYFDGKSYWLADGFHRTLAAINAGKKTVKVTVHHGTVKDAMLHAAGSNPSHGLRRTPGDKRNAVRMLLDAGHWSDKSVNWLARACSVSHSLATSVYNGWHESQQKPVPTVRQSSDGREMNTGAIGRQRNTPPPEPESNPTRPPETGKPDAIGRIVPDRHRDAHLNATDARGIIRDLGAMVARCRAFKNSPGGVWFNFSEAERCLSQAQEELKFSLFHTECPKCLESEPSKDCKVCKGHGWINRGIFGRLSDQDKKALGMAPF